LKNLFNKVEEVEVGMQLAEKHIKKISNVEILKFSVYFSGSCIPTKESLSVNISHSGAPEPRGQ
jgi:hypothetical protein